MIRETIQDEKGFWAAFMLMLTVTLALLGMGAAVLIRSEGVAVARKISTLQAEYSADAAVQFSIRAMQLGTYYDGMSVPDIGGATVTVDTAATAGGVVLTVSAGKLNAHREVKVTMNGALGAVLTTGDSHWRLLALNESGWYNSGLIDEYVASPPPVDTTALRALAASQGYEKNSSFNPPNNNYPAASFYTVDGVTPYVTWVDGDLTITNNNDAFGIFVVTGKVTLGTNSRINGVIYSPGSQSVEIDASGSRHSVIGGLITHSDIIVNGTFLQFATVRYKLDYIQAFETFGNVGYTGAGSVYFYVDNITYY